MQCPSAMRSPEHEREIETRKASAFRTTLVTFRGESEHSDLPSVVWALFLSLLVPGMTAMGYVQPERLVQHQSLLWYWWGVPWPKSTISLDQPSCLALSLYSTDLDNVHSFASLLPIPAVFVYISGNISAGLFWIQDVQHLYEGWHNPRCFCSNLYHSRTTWRNQDIFW